MEEKNRSHGKIDRLPAPLKREVEGRLLNGDTYESISGYLAEQGENVHASSVHRYGKGFLKKFESVRIAKEFAKLARIPLSLAQTALLLLSELSVVIRIGKEGNSYLYELAV